MGRGLASDSYGDVVGLAVLLGLLPHRTGNRNHLSRWSSDGRCRDRLGRLPLLGRGQSQPVLATAGNFYAVVPSCYLSLDHDPRSLYKPGIVPRCHLRR